MLTETNFPRRLIGAPQRPLVSTILLAIAAVLAVFMHLEDAPPPLSEEPEAVELGYLDLAKEERLRGLHLLEAGRYDAGVTAFCDAKLLRDASDKQQVLTDLEELIELSVMIADEKMGRGILAYRYPTTRRGMRESIDYRGHLRLRADQLTTRARVLINAKAYARAREAAHRATCFDSSVDAELYEDLITISRSLDDARGH